MTTVPVFYDDGCDRFVWCVDERGVIRVWPLAGFPDARRERALAQWGWRYATEAEVTEYLAVAGGVTAPRASRPAR